MARWDLIDWQDGVLRTDAWLRSQPGLFRGVNVVETRLYPNPASVEMDIAIGQGRFGRNALRITNKTAGSLPDFRIISRDKNNASAGSSPAKPRFTDGYLVPPWIRATKLHVIMKFPTGFRHAESAATESSTNSQNYHVGTHHHDPATIPPGGFSGGILETNNWHHYHQLSVRHDLAGDGWVHFVISPTPTHQRSRSGFTPAPRLTGSRSSYFECCPTIYFAPNPYGADNTDDPSTFTVNIPTPYVTLIDSIYVTDDAEYQPVTVEFVGLKMWQELEAVRGVVTRWYDVRVTNTLSQPITGKIVAHGISQTTAVRDKATQASVKNADITLAPNETRTLEFRTTIASNFSSGMAPASVAFIPATEESRPRYGVHQVPSKADPYVCYRPDAYGYVGPPDADICDAGITFFAVGAFSGTEKPWTLGGQKWECEKNKPLTRQLDVHDPQGLPMTVTLVDYDAVRKGQWQHTALGGGSLTISPTGLVSYSPLTDFEGTIFFRYRVANGVRDSGIFGNWINVSKRTVVARAGNEALVANGSLLVIGQ